MILDTGYGILDTKIFAARERDEEDLPFPASAANH
jgi:hypothetical protein